MKELGEIAGYVIVHKQTGEIYKSSNSGAKIFKSEKKAIAILVSSLVDSKNPDDLNYNQRKALALLYYDIKPVYYEKMYRIYETQTPREWIIDEEYTAH